MTTATLLLLAALILVVAALYSSVGHAGASGYLAVMALFGLAPAEAKPTATCLNILVATLTTYQFARAGHFSWRLLWPFALGSVALAFAGGRTTLTDTTYKMVVGVLLLAAAGRLLVGQWPTVGGAVRRPPVVPAVLLGAAIGYVSGLTGTGGGILLTPLLIILRWSDPKPASGVSAAFILINSLAGLAGQLNAGITLPAGMPYLVAAAGLGGLVGSFFGARRFGLVTLRRLLAVVLVIAGLKLMLAG